jgi:histidyl-tRNA synthetase
MERLILALGDKAPKPDTRVEYLATLGKDARIKGIGLAEKIRMAYNRDYRVRVKALLGGFGGASLKSQMRAADRNGAKAVVIIGEDELKKGVAMVRDMTTNEQAEVPFSDIVGMLDKLLKIEV